MLAAAGGQVLEDVRLPSVVVRWRSEHNGEDVVHVRRVKVKPSCPSLQVLELVCSYVKQFNAFNRSHLESVGNVADFERVRNSVLAARDVFADLMGFSASYHELFGCWLLLLERVEATRLDWGLRESEQIFALEHCLCVKLLRKPEHLILR